METTTPKRRVLVIGLDCAAPELVFERWRDELPTFSRLMDEGFWGRLESCMPPITVPAWMSMLTSKDPGQLGIYGFRTRREYTYRESAVANSTDVKEPVVYDVLGQAGKHVSVVGIPCTYPPRPVNGEMVTCFLTPGLDSQFTYPPELKDEVLRVAPDYMFDVRDFRTEDKAYLLQQIYNMTYRRFALVHHLMATKPWDFLMFVEMGTDRIHHGLWKYMDEQHRKFPGETPFLHAIRDYYKFLDGQIAALLSQVGDETTVLVVSDHGAKRMDGGICINEWLMREGYLVLKSKPEGIVPLEKCVVDWEKTRAWAAGGYYGRIFINLKGREQQGCVEPEDYERLRDELAARLEALGDENGNPIGTVVSIPAETYKSVKGIAPDLTVLFGDLYWRAVGSLGHPSVHTFENDTGPDDANHAQFGMFIMRDNRLPIHGEVEARHLMDVAPTILSALDVPVPGDMLGDPIQNAVPLATPETAPAQTVAAAASGPGFTLWFTGLSGAGKTTIGELVNAELKARGRNVEMLDGDIVRTNLSKGLGFSREDRDTNIYRIGFVCNLLTRNGAIAIATAISPYREVRDNVRAQIGNFVEVYVATPVEECIRRDVKGLYKQAIAGEIKEFTGISDPYEPPLAPEITINTTEQTPQESAAQIITWLETHGYLAPAAKAETKPAEPANAEVTPAAPAAPAVYSAEEEELVSARLEALGYL
jgi:adenylyl-sulfate kinase